MSKRILFIGGNFFPEQTGIGKYSGEMIGWLGREGFKCTVITTYPYYPQWCVEEPYTKTRFWFTTETNSEFPNVRIIRCPHYVPKNPSGIKRMLSDISFTFTAFFSVLVMLFTKKHDYVFTVAPPFCLGLLAVMYQKVRGAKFLYHIQDLQIDVAQHLKIIRSTALLNVLRTFERFILKRADFISSISPGMMLGVKYKCEREIVHLPNWVDTQKFYPISKDDKNIIGFDLQTGKKIILYSGAIGEKQGLEAILHSAKKFEENTDWIFVICGCGPYKEKLVQIKENLNLTNVMFIPIQPVEKLNSLLNIADLHLVLQKAGAVNFTMPSKFSTIMAVGGVSVVTAQEDTCLYNLIEKSNTALMIPPENQAALNKAILSGLTKDHSEIKNNARSYAERHLAIDEILSDFSAIVFNRKKGEVFIKQPIPRKFVQPVS